MSKKITREEIYVNINTGAYDPGIRTKEDMTMKEWRQKKTSLVVKFQKHLKEAYELPESFVDLAWQEGHAEGLHSVADIAAEYDDAISKAILAAELRPHPFHSRYKSTRKLFSSLAPP